MTTDLCPDVKAIIKAVCREDLSTVAGAFRYQCGKDLVKEGLDQRRRTRITLICDGKPQVLYLKRYGTYKGKHSPAHTEFYNIKTARLAGIPTMREIIFGEDSWTGHSYLIVTAVPGDALERRFEHYMQTHTHSQIEMLTYRLAFLVRSLHNLGYVHRDLYSCHVFLDDTADPQLYLIDLARMFFPRWRKFRWRVKDLAQLKYSMPSAWVESHWNDFLSQYHGEKTEKSRRIRHAIDRKVAFIRRQVKRRASNLKT